VEGPIRIRELGDMAPECCVVSPKSEQIIFQGRFGDLIIVFPRKEMNTKVKGNFMAHNLDTEITLFGVRAWEI
jgi:hypothetical protein